MGLLGALNNAVSGLNVNQQSLSVLSQNVSNANTPGYSREVANQQADFIAGQGQGASIASITRAVNEFLNTQVRTQTSVNSSALALTDYYSQIQNFLGQPGANNSIDQSISAFFVAVQALANSPSASAQASVVDTGSQMASGISGLANSLQGLRLQADQDISNSVNTINSDIQNLFQNNQAIEQAVATKQGAAGLLDKRDSLLNDLAQYVDIRPVEQPDGSVVINTASGVTLLTTTTYSALSHPAASSVQTFINNGSLSPINVTTLDSNGNALGQPVALATGGPSSSVTSSIGSGKLNGLLAMRDSIIPNVLSQLDQLSGMIRDGFNAITNAGTSFPPPNSYTGTTLLSGASTSLYSGSIRIAALGNNGNPVTSPYPDEPNGLQPLTLDLSKLDTGKGAGTDSVDGIINAINQYFGPPQNKMEIGNLNNVQLGLVSNNVPDTSGSTVSFDFNLDNISANSASFYVGGITVQDSAGTTIASSTAFPPTVTTTQPAVALAPVGTYQTTLGSNTVTLTTAGTNTLANGDIIYLNPPPGAVNGISASALGGYFTVSNVSGNSFSVTVSGPGATSTGPANAAGVTALPQYDTVNSGGMTRTGADGVLTASLAGNPASPYYTIQANIATVDATGKLVTSTVSYRVTNNTSNVMNNLIGATAAAGGGTVVAPVSTQPILTATLVDANGNPLSKINGVYGNQQGYLKIAATNSTGAVAIDELDSKELGLALSGIPATNMGFSQYFGLNNFFNPAATVTGNTTTNSAINLSVESRLISNPGLVSAGKLALGLPSTGGAPNFTYVLSSGDNSISQRLAGLATQLNSFAAVGGLSSSNTTFSQYAGQIIAATSTNSTNATSVQKDSQALLNGFVKSAQSDSGVNLDQELANTIIFQNAYSASARIVTVVSTMFNDLVNIIH